MAFESVNPTMHRTKANPGLRGLRHLLLGGALAGAVSGGMAACNMRVSQQTAPPVATRSAAAESSDRGRLSWAWERAEADWWRRGQDLPSVRAWGNLATDHLAFRELREHLGALTGLVAGEAATGEMDAAMGGAVVLALASDRPPVSPLPTEPESYRLLWEGDGPLWVVGADDRGLLYGVYDLLEGWGVRWFQPGDLGTHLPRVDRLPLPRSLQRSGTPAFPDRGYHITGTGRMRDGRAMIHYDDETLRWMLRNRMNFKSIHNSQADEVLPMLAELHLKGLPFGHSYSRWVPAEDFERHPEWFALVGGKRVAGGQLCVSNPELREAVVERVVAFLDRHPGLPFVSLAPNDGYRFCQCEGCLAMDTREDREKGELNRRHHLFTAAIAHEVVRRRPGARVSSISYSNYLDPAEDAAPEPAMVVSATIRASLAHAIDDPSSPMNAAVWRRLKRWAELSGGVYYSEYYLSYGGLYPRPFHRATAATLRALHDAGIRGVKSEVSPGANPKWRSAVLHMYLVTRFLWDPGQDLGRFLDDFYELYYGPAAADARLIHETFQEAVERYGGEIPAMDARLMPDLFREEDVRVLTEAAGRATAQAERGGWPYTERVAALAEQARLIEASRAGVLTALSEPTGMTVERESETGQASALVLRHKETLLPLEPPSRVRISRDDEAIVVRYRVEEKVGDASIPQGGDRVWRLSHADFFLSPDPESGVYYQVAVDWEGNSYTARCHGREWDATYPLTLEKRAQVDADGWAVEVRIPFASLGTRPPQAGDRWRGGFNVGLRHSGTSRYGGWPRGASFHDIEQFGELRFDD